MLYCSHPLNSKSSSSLPVPVNLKRVSRKVRYDTSSETRISAGVHHVLVQLRREEIGAWRARVSLLRPGWRLKYKSKNQSTYSSRGCRSQKKSAQSVPNKSQPTLSAGQRQGTRHFPTATANADKNGQVNSQCRQKGRGIDVVSRANGSLFGGKADSNNQLSRHRDTFPSCKYNRGKSEVDTYNGFDGVDQISFPLELKSR